MAKRLMILAGTLAMLLATAVPALAQEEANQGEAADALPPVPPGYERVVWTFELTVEGDAPEDAAFFGRTIAPAGAGAGAGTSDVPLTDPDGDGIYTGSDFGYLVPGSETPNFVNTPPTLQIVQNAGPKARVIKDFGVVPLDEDKTFQATVSFPENGSSGNRGSSSSGSSSSGSSSSGSGKSNPAGDSSSGGSSSGSGGGGAKAGGAKAKELPRTGGELPALGLVGALLVGGGLLVRHAAR